MLVSTINYSRNRFVKLSEMPTNISRTESHFIYVLVSSTPNCSNYYSSLSCGTRKKKEKEKKKGKLRVPRKLASFVQKALMVVQINFIVPFFPNVTWGESMNTMKMVINFRKIFRLFIKSHYIMITLHYIMINKKYFFSFYKHHNL